MSGDDPLVKLLYAILVGTGVLALVRFALENVGDFVKWFRRWRQDLKG